MLLATPDGAPGRPSGPLLDRFGMTDEVADSRARAEGAAVDAGLGRVVVSDIEAPTVSYEPCQ